MNHGIERLKASRNFFLRLTAGFTNDQWNEKPAGFNNNPIRKSTLDASFCREGVNMAMLGALQLSEALANALPQSDKRLYLTPDECTSLMH